MDFEPCSAPGETADGARPTGFIFVTPVWGEAYTQLFVDTALPCQMSAGNLPGMSNLPGSTYMIVTTQEDAETIRAAQSFQSLTRIVDTRIVIIEDEIVNPHETMSDCYRHGIALAEQRDAAVVFLTPDCVIADGGFVALERLAMLGKRVVYVTGIRTLKQAVQFQLHQLLVPDGSIAAAPSVLARIALDSIHPMARSSLWEDDGYDLVPANLFWRVGAEGIVARCYHLHPLLVFPDRKQALFYSTIDDDYVQSTCPDASKHYIVQDSDEVLIIELSDPERRFFTGLRKGNIEDAVVWVERFTDTRHRTLIETTIRLHTGIGDVAAWRDVEQEADHIVAQIQRLLNRGNLHLALKNPQAFSGRLLKQAQERTALLSTAGKRTGSDGQPEAGSFGYPALRFIARGRAWLRHAPPLAIMRSLCVYVQSVSFMSRKVHAARKRLLGSYDRATLFSFTGPYYQQLKRDLDAAFTEIGPRIVACVNAADPVGVIAAARGDAPRQAVCVALPNLVRVCDRQSGNALPDRSVTGLFVDLQSCSDTELRLFLREASRVLVDTGRIAIKSDWLPNPSIQQTGQQIHLSRHVLAELLRPDFEIVSQRRQGRIGTAIMGMLHACARGTARRLPLPTGIKVFVAFFMLPLHLLVGLIAQILTVFLDALDRTDHFYVSSITVAQKK